MDAESEENMSRFHEVKPEEWSKNPFQAIGKEWMLVTAEKDGRANCLTASWGGVGVLWGKNVVYIFIRGSRYTKEFIDGSDTFSLTFFDRQQYGDLLAYMGKTSGRDEDKIGKCGLTLLSEEAAPYYAEASCAVICKKMCCQPVEAANFCVEGLDAQFYADKDYHTMYVGEIVRILER